VVLNAHFIQMSSFNPKFFSGANTLVMVVCLRGSVMKKMYAACYPHLIQAALSLVPQHGATSIFTYWEIFSF
jgi:hypothetical protein